MCLTFTIHTFGESAACRLHPFRNATTAGTPELPAAGCQITPRRASIKKPSMRDVLISHPIPSDDASSMSWTRRWLK
tara:strand:+ start:1291 stop:1521 length:231 start_codon:yes stop_codon:yes gene_type:complete